MKITNPKNKFGSSDHQNLVPPILPFCCSPMPQDGSVTLEEFISGLLTMKGPAKAIDVKTIAAGHGDGGDMGLPSIQWGDP